MNAALQVLPTETDGLPEALSIEGRKRAALMCEHIARAHGFHIAADLAGVPQSTAMRWRSRAPEFQQMLAIAEERRTQLLEAEAWRRALAGSDTLLIFMLKGARPTIYRENGRLEITGPNGMPLALGDGQRAARIVALLQAIEDKAHAVMTESVQPIVDAEFTEITTQQDDCSDLF